MKTESRVDNNPEFEIFIAIKSNQIKSLLPIGAWLAAPRRVHFVPSAEICHISLMETSFQLPQEDAWWAELEPNFEMPDVPAAQQFLELSKQRIGRLHLQL